jgi:hypothetical protein
MLVSFLRCCQTSMNPLFGDKATLNVLSQGKNFRASG